MHVRDPKGFYVYILFRETGIPLYVGKGRGARWFIHEKRAKDGDTYKDRAIRKILLKRRDVPKIKVAEGLTNKQAALIEIALIAAIGRDDLGKGPLVNLTDGGDGCVSPSRAVRVRMGAKNKGRIHTKETRAKMSAAKQGFQISPEARAIGAAKRTGQKRSEEAKAKMRAAKLGKKLSPEHVAKIAAKNKGRVFSLESRANMSAGRLAIDVRAIVKNSWRPGGPRRAKLEGTT